MPLQLFQEPICPAFLRTKQTRCPTLPVWDHWNVYEQFSACHHCFLWPYSGVLKLTLKFKKSAKLASAYKSSSYCWSYSSHFPIMGKKNLNVICLATEHQGVHKNSFRNVRAFQLELEFGNVGFWGEGKTRVPGEKCLGAEKRTNNKLNPHMTPGPGIEPGSHWWEASALTTAPSLLPS